MDKHEIASLLNQIAILLELKGENPFKIRAYHNAARALENLEEDLEVIISDGRLKEIPGIGASTAEKIQFIHEKGHLPYYEELKKSIPDGLQELLKVPGLGGRKIKILYEELGVKSIEDLIQACRKGEVELLAHFGKKSQTNILNSINKLKKIGHRILWWEAIKIANMILNQLSKAKGVQRAEIAGSLRRKLETVGDLDFLVASSTPEVVMNWFTQQRWVEKILAKGPTKSSVLLTQGIQADLRIIPEEQFAFALMYFTGSRDHSIKIRQRANELGYSLSEYDLEPLDCNQALPFSKQAKRNISEADVFKVLGLSYIPPELREERGEIEAAEKGLLPKLIEEKDIQGVFHCHTTYSDGHNTLEEMVSAAEALNWEYIGISDHSKSSYQANGMSEEQLLDQVQAIQKMNQSRKHAIHVFAGLECDILSNGELDFPDKVLKQLDFVIVSIHRSFNLDEKTMTNRLIKAIENPYSTIVGHVTGRILLRRDPYHINLPKVIDACIANQTVIELNAQPNRLDLDWRYWHKAAEKGLKCCINPDAHSVHDLLYVRGGINIAKKGWLTKNDVLNSLPLKKIKAFLKE